MPDLFGINIAGILNDAISGAGGLRTGLYFEEQASTLNTDNLTAPQHKTYQTYSCQCYTSNMSAYQAERSSVQSTGIIGIIGASLGVIPKVGDKITIDATTYELTELINVDPASAVYKFGSKASQEPIVIPPPVITGRAFSAAFSGAFG